MMWLPKKFDDTFSRFDRIPACDRQTDGRTNGHLATAQSVLCIASHAKNSILVLCITLVNFD